jgi:hypothetical protein
MYLIRSTLLFITLLLTLNSSQAKSTYSISSSTIKDYIKYLLNLTGVENEYARFLSYMKIQPPKDNLKLRALYDEFFSTNAYIADVTQIYAKYYTLDEITALIKFYSSPLGKKNIQLNSDLNKRMEDLMLTKISEYIFTSAEHGMDISLP